MPLKRLPLLPGSGYPLHYITEELSCYWLQAMVYTLGGLGIALAVPFCFASFTEDPVVGIAIACVWALVTGVVIGRSASRRWEQDTLFNGEITTTNDNDGSGLENVYPDAIATPVSQDADAFRDDKEEAGTEMTKVIV